MAELSRIVDSMEYDGLISGLTPKVKVTGGTIRKLDSESTLERGTILARSSGTAGDDKLVVLGTTAASNETLTADCILADDITVGDGEDVNVAVYDMGCFDPDKVKVADGYTITAADKDALRQRGIYFVSKSDAN